jgi:hypothetical protein
MDGSPLLPVRVDVLTEILNQFRNLMGTDRLMPTPADLNVSRTEISSIRTEPIKRYPMQVQELRGPEPEAPVRMLKILHHLDYGVILTEAI